MKTLAFAIFISIIGLLLLSCNSNVSTEKNNEIKDSQNQEQADVNNEDGTNENEEITKIEPKKAFHEEILIKPNLIKNGEIINDLTVANTSYKPNESFGFDLKGNFELGGSLMIDEMWSEPAIQIDNEQNPYKNIIIELDGIRKQVFSYCYFSNADALLKALTEKERNALNRGESISVKIKAKDFSTGGKLDGYGDSKITFVEIVK